jgi:hypothetical protein
MSIGFLPAYVRRPSGNGLIEGELSVEANGLGVAGTALAWAELM